MFLKVKTFSFRQNFYFLIIKKKNISLIYEIKLNKQDKKSYFFSNIEKSVIIFKKIEITIYKINFFIIKKLLMPVKFLNLKTLFLASLVSFITKLRLPTE